MTEDSTTEHDNPDVVGTGEPVGLPSVAEVRQDLMWLRKDDGLSELRCQKTQYLRLLPAIEFEMTKPKQRARGINAVIEDLVKCFIRQGEFKKPYHRTILLYTMNIEPIPNGRASNDLSIRRSDSRDVIRTDGEDFSTAEEHALLALAKQIWSADRSPCNLQDVPDGDQAAAVEAERSADATLSIMAYLAGRDAVIRYLERKLASVQALPDEVRTDTEPVSTMRLVLTSLVRARYADAAAQWKRDHAGTLLFDAHEFLSYVANWFDSFGTAPDPELPPSTRVGGHWPNEAERAAGQSIGASLMGRPPTPEESAQALKDSLELLDTALYAVTGPDEWREILSVGQLHSHSVGRP